MNVNRRTLLGLMAAAVGSGSSSLRAFGGEGPKSEDAYRGPLRLEGRPRGKKVIVLGAGLAGLTAALELHHAGYAVQVLEYNTRIGGRCWTIRGGDRYTELGGHTQHCEFAPGVYMNPGPWRISHTHRTILDYCSRLGVPMESFVQLNYNGYVHARNVMGGKPQRYHEVAPDFNGYVGELLSAALQDGSLGKRISAADAQRLRAQLQVWAGLTPEGRYELGAASSRMRGPAAISDEDASTTFSEPKKLGDILDLCEAAGVWRGANHPGFSSFQMSLLQPVGGMDMIAKALARDIQHLIRTQAKVSRIQQSDRGVRVTYEDVTRPGSFEQVEADWCICTIPPNILSQIQIDIDTPMRRAIDAIGYSSETKIGLQFKRRFWEQDDAIYGGFSVTDLPIRQIYYPSYGWGDRGPGMLYGAVLHKGGLSYEFTGMTPQQRIAKTLEYGAQLHPQYKSEFQNGMAIAWHRNPYSMGCTAIWTPELVKAHYTNIRAFDGRLVLAGEGYSVHGWQDGTMRSALNAVERLHQRAVAGA